MSKRGDAQSIFERMRNAATLTAPTTIGVLPQDLYPDKPHAMMALSKQDTELSILHDFMAMNLEALNQQELQQWEAEKEGLEQKYFFSASTDNKWSEFTFDRWRADLLLLVLQHVVTRYSHIDAGSSSRQEGKHLFQPSTTKERDGASTPRGRASMFCPELLYDLALVINEDTIEQDLDDYAKRVHPSQHAIANSKELHDGKSAAAQQHIDVFKTNTKATIDRINQIISHECERLILLVMPNGENTSIFKRLLHHRSKYLEDSYKDPDKYGPYNADQSFKFLKQHCTGNNERMKVLYSFTLINHERQQHQNILAWSRSFIPLIRAMERFADPPTTATAKKAYKKTFYHEPFVGQLTTREIQTLNGGGFLQKANEHLDQEKLEEWISQHEGHFQVKFTPDKRTKEFISSKKKLFASVYPKPRESTKRKRKNDSTTTLYIDNKKPNKQQSSKGKGRGRNQYSRPYWPPYSLLYEKGRPWPSPHYKGKGAGKGYDTKGKGKGKGKSKGKDHRYKGGKGKQPPRSSWYGNRGQPNTNRWSNQRNPAGSPAKGKGNNRNAQQGASTQKLPLNNQIRCNFCNKIGHIAKNCWSLQKIKGSKPYSDIMVAASDDQKPGIDRLIDSVNNPYCPVCCDHECPVNSDSLDPHSECANGETDHLASAKELFFSDDAHPLMDIIKHEKQNGEEPPTEQPESSSTLYTDPEEQWDPGTDHSWPDDNSDAWWDEHMDHHQYHDHQSYGDLLYYDYGHEPYDAPYSEEE